MRTSASITGTSTSTPITAASAAPEVTPNMAMAEATASSKKLLARLEIGMVGRAAAAEVQIGIGGNGLAVLFTHVHVEARLAVPGRATARTVVGGEGCVLVANG